MKDKELSGGCSCGKIRYNLKAEPVSAAMCHCTDCRKAAGAQSVAWITVPLESYTIVTGDPKQYHSSPKVTRTFCSDCGTPLTYRHEDRGRDIDITTGSLDDPERYPPTKDIFDRDRLSWVKTTTDIVKQ